MIKRTTNLYGNCRVYSPSNQLMFRCLEKKIKWYLTRGLAELIEENPPSIRLKFEPKGNGERTNDLKVERNNICVVCGEKDLSILTRHHIVPYEYRKHMPNDKKQNSSVFVVPICINCHRKYENDFSSKVKDKLSIEYDTTHREKDEHLSDTISKLNCLIKHSNKLPLDIKASMMCHINDYFHSNGILNKIDFSNIDELKEIFLKLKNNQFKNIKSHGQLVIEKCKDLSSFEKMWVNDFIKNMNPMYLPDYIKQLI
jgi:hypothetical protein